MATDELSGRVHHDVGSVLYRTNEIWCAESVVDHQGDTMLVGNGCRALNVADVGVRITKGLNIYEFGVRLNGCLQCIVIVWVDKCCINAILAQRVLQQIIGSAVDGICCHHMVTGVCQVGDSVSHSSSA